MTTATWPLSIELSSFTIKMRQVHRASREQARRIRPTAMSERLVFTKMWLPVWTERDNRWVRVSDCFCIVQWFVFSHNYCSKSMKMGINFKLTFFNVYNFCNIFQFPTIIVTAICCCHVLKSLEKKHNINYQKNQKTPVLWLNIVAFFLPCGTLHRLENLPCLRLSGTRPWWEICFWLQGLQWQCRLSQTHPAENEI